MLLQIADSGSDALTSFKIGDVVASGSICIKNFEQLPLELKKV